MLSDDEILRLAKGVYERRAAARSKKYTYCCLTPEKRAAKAAYMKEYHAQPEVKAKRKAYWATPEARKISRDAARRRYWAKHHPDQPVSPGRIAKEQWNEGYDNRLRDAEADIAE